MASVLSRLSFATAAEKQLKQQKLSFLHLKDVKISLHNLLLF